MTTATGIQHYRLNDFHLREIPPIVIPPVQDDETPSLTQILVQNTFVCTSCTKLYSADIKIGEDGVPTIVLTPHNGPCRCSAKTITMNKSTQTDLSNVHNPPTSHTPAIQIHTNQPTNIGGHLKTSSPDPFVHLPTDKSEWHPNQCNSAQPQRHSASTSNNQTDHNNNIGTYSPSPYSNPFAANSNLFDSPEWYSMLNDFNLQNLQTLDPDPFEHFESFE